MRRAHLSTLVDQLSAGRAGGFLTGLRALRAARERGCGSHVVIGLLRTYLRPYHRQIVIVLVMLLIQAVATLYLPNLNADIIDKGIATG